MKFGPVPVAQAAGAVLAHSLRLPEQTLRKGRVLSAQDCAAMVAAGMEYVTVARLGPDDMGEDAAATAVAQAMVPDPDQAGLTLSPAFTGRVNLSASGPGIALIDTARIAQINLVDPMITVATPPAFARVWPGALMATIKIISYAVPSADVARACAAASGAIRRAPPVLRRAGLIVTQIDAPSGPGPSGYDAISGRLAALDVALADVVHVPHQIDPLANAVQQMAGTAGIDLVLILTASATSDLADVAPQAVQQAGGRIDRFGMPVDPGNLLFLGGCGVVPVIGLPGCARSPALNGADWVLERVICGHPPSPEDIAMMGVGGLLKEIPTRPHPRRRRPMVPDEGAA